MGWCLMLPQDFHRNTHNTGDILEQTNNMHDSPQITHFKVCSGINKQCIKRKCSACAFSSRLRRYNFCYKYCDSLVAFTLSDRVRAFVLRLLKQWVRGRAEVGTGRWRWRDGYGSLAVEVARAWTEGGVTWRMGRQEAVFWTGQCGTVAGPACQWECWVLRLSAWPAKGSLVVEKDEMSFFSLFFSEGKANLKQYFEWDLVYLWTLQPPITNLSHLLVPFSTGFLEPRAFTLLSRPSLRYPHSPLRDSRLPGVLSSSPSHSLPFHYHHAATTTNNSKKTKKTDKTLPISSKYYVCQ